MNDILGPDVFISHQENRLLLLNESKAYKTEKVIKALQEKGVQSIFVPAGFTRELQPLDVFVNKSVMAILHKEWQNWFDSLKHIFTKAENRRRPSYQELVDMTSKVYEGIITKTEMIKAVMIILKFIIYIYICFKI